MSAVAVAVAAALAAASMPAPPADGQELPLLRIWTDRDWYGPGDVITVHGLAGAPHHHMGAVTLRVVSPGGGVAAVGQVVPDGLDWSWSVPAGFDRLGTYEIRAHYGLGRNGAGEAAAPFTYGGIVAVAGTNHTIKYTGGPVARAHTDAAARLLYLEFDGPASGAVRLPDGLVSGDPVAVAGGGIAALSGNGTYSYTADGRGDPLVLAADAVAVPEFGAVHAAALLAAAGAAPLLARGRARRRGAARPLLPGTDWNPQSALRARSRGTRRAPFLRPVRPARSGTAARGVPR